MMKSDTRIEGITVNFYKSVLIFKKKVLQPYEDAKC